MAKAVHYSDHALNLTCHVTTSTNSATGTIYAAGHCVNKDASHSSGSGGCNATYSNCYVGADGQQCTTLDVQNATALFNAIFDQNLSTIAMSNVKNHYKNVNLACAAPNIKGKCCIPEDKLHICISEIVLRTCSRPSVSHACYASGDINNPKEHNADAFKAFCDKMRAAGEL